ncbi:MAG TPA: hypothetical protein VNQ90_13170 [Chthoniobacteraceae bacterium]|nr:hypothetical protein [Chthoniobacteraceae bacterium]
MKQTAIAITLLIPMFATGCATNSAPGANSARINDGRTRPDALVSQSSYENQHRQRRNESEEYALRRQERQDQYEAVITPVKTATDTLGLLGIRLGR